MLLRPYFQKAVEGGGGKTEGPKVTVDKPAEKIVAPSKSPEELSHSENVSRLLKALGQRDTGKNEYFIQIPGAGEHSLIIQYPGKVEISYVTYTPSKGIFTPDKMGRSSPAYVCKITDLLSGKVEDFHNLANYLKIKDEEATLRESRNLIEDNAGLRAQMEKAYINAMDIYFKYSDEKFMTEFPDKTSFSSKFKDQFRKFLPLTLFSIAADNLKATYNGLSIIYNKGKGVSETAKGSYSLSSSGDFYSNVEGIYETKLADIKGKLAKK